MTLTIYKWSLILKACPTKWDVLTSQTYLLQIQEATAQAATVKIIVAKELESRLSGFTTSALKSKAEVQLTSDQLAQALSGLAPTEAVEKPLVEHFFVQLQQQQANLFSNVSDIHQALAALLSELKHS